MNVEKAYSIADLREMARRTLPKGIFEFVDRGAEDEVALRNNRAAYERIKLRPKALVDVSKRSSAATILGHRHGMPLAIAPTGAAGLLWYNGELELARAAVAANLPFALATRSMASIEQIRKEVGAAAHLWFQLYVWDDRSISYGMVDRARDADYDALIVTVDTPVAPNREHNDRNGFSLPFQPSGKTLIDMALHPRWLVKVMGRYLRTTGMPRFENLPDALKTRITQGDTSFMRMGSLSWEDVRELRKRWPRKLMLKGIMRAEDARTAVEHGVDVLILSNHGGRNMDSSDATIDVLPEIVDAVGGKVSILIDSGIRRGGDIIKALALGADAVLAGRPTLYGISAAGEKGAARALAILKHEMETTMGMIGCPRVEDIDAGVLRPGSLPAARRERTAREAAE